MSSCRWIIYGVYSQTPNGPELQPLDVAIDGKLSSFAPVHKNLTLSSQEIEMTQIEEEKSAEELAPPHVLNELCDNAPYLFKVMTGLTLEQVHEILR
jgi:hypothetical protein